MKRTPNNLRPSEPPKAKKPKVSQLLDPVEYEPKPRTGDKSVAQSANHIPVQVTPAPHPLCNNVVLEVLFGFLAETDLRSCRVVHPTWNFEALPHLKKRGRSFLQIRTYPNLCSFNYSAHFRQLSNYIKDSTPDDIPFSVEKVCFSKMHTDLQVYGAAWRDLLKVLANRVTEVIVRLHDHGSPCIPRGITFSKLTTLRVGKGTWSYLGTMVESSPNLKTLELEHMHYMTLANLSEMNGLKLETFKMRWLYDRDGNRARNHEGNDGLEAFLKCQKNTLRHLVLDTRILRIYPNIAEILLPNTTISTE